MKESPTWINKYTFPYHKTVYISQGFSKVVYLTMVIQLQRHYSTECDLKMTSNGIVDSHGLYENTTPSFA